MSVCVLGELAMELAVALPGVPPAEGRVVGQEVDWRPGGSGYLMAACLARLGIATSLAGAVGDDVFGEQVLSGARGAGVDVERVTVAPGRGTGVTVQAVSPGGQRTLAVVPGANEALAAPTSDAAVFRGGCTALVLDLALGQDVLRAMLSRAPERMLAIGHGAPARDTGLPWARLDLTVVSPQDLRMGDRSSPLTIDEVATEAAPLMALGLKQVVVCAGSEGAFLVERDGATHFHAYPTRPVDTSGAREAFTATLTWALSVGRGPYEGIDLALAAQALTLSRPGSAASFPELKALVGFLAGQAGR